MRISDWSSDVCSSDLPRSCGQGPCNPARRGGSAGSQIPPHLAFRRCLFLSRPLLSLRLAGCLARQECLFALDTPAVAREVAVAAHHAVAGDRDRQAVGAAGLGHRTHRLRLPDARSEEHTSELQSLMRISSAVFCLKKKKM